VGTNGDTNRISSRGPVPAVVRVRCEPNNLERLVTYRPNQKTVDVKNTTINRFIFEHQLRISTVMTR